MSLYSLDFCEDDVDVRAGDVLAIDDLAVFAELGPVLAIHILSGGFGVSMDGKLLEGVQKLLHVCAFGHPGKPLIQTHTNTINKQYSTYYYISHETDCQ